MSGLDEKGRYCTCNSKTNPCIVCGKPKFIDPEWLKRKIEEEPDGMEVGAGFEIFSAPASASATPADVGEEPVHKWTGNGPGIRGADNCQHVSAMGEQCGRWSEDAETATCRNAIPSTPSMVEQTISGETVAGVPVLGWMWEVDAPLAGKTRQTAYHWSTPPSNVNVTRLVDATALERVVRERDTLRARLETVEAETRERCAEEAVGMAVLFVNGPAKTVYGKGYQDGCNKSAEAIRNLEPRHD